MFFLLLFTVKMHIYSDKTTYLVGENIYVGCEVINKGDNNVFVEKHLFVRGLLSESAMMWNKQGEYVPHYVVAGGGLSSHNKGKKMDSILLIQPGDTLRIKEECITDGTYGNALYCKGPCIGNRYILPGEYYLTIPFCYYEFGEKKKAFSDTLKIVIVSPAGRNKNAWMLYKRFREKAAYFKAKEMAEYSIKLIKKYPESAYLDELFYYWHHFTFVENWESKNPEMKREINETRRERRELLNLIKENIKKYKGRTQREALWAIIQGEMALGTPLEEIKSFVINSGVPLDKEIKDYFGIKESEK